ncbi:MAG: stress response translation initiation inhibitor YciH [Candidatus Lokiarchaeota archaeon]|nr:stress response translation initiation inhibitor YciH [Candidatus Lokiarchaeota archaeon]
MKDDDICAICSFPKDLCICDSLSADEQQIIISNDRRKWGKVVSVITFEGNIDANLKDILTKAKKKCASGGVVRGNAIELQGDHKFKLKKFLIDLGFPEENIIIQEGMIRKRRY